MNGLCTYVFFQSQYVLSLFSVFGYVSVCLQVPLLWTLKCVAAINFQ